ncbi:MAG: hypothetical protein WC544_01145 [Patescibacteria group bacterium]
MDMDRWPADLGKIQNPFIRITGILSKITIGGNVVYPLSGWVDMVIADGTPDDVNLLRSRGLVIEIISD